MTTKRQKEAVHFCEEWLDISFEGDINNFNQVSNFLSMYLDSAKSTFNDAVESYYSFILDTSMSRSNDERKMLTEDYFKVLNIYTNVRDYYEKTFNKEIIIEDALLPLKEEKLLIYSTSKVNPLNAKIISDLKDIPEEYYENIINLINGFKYGTLPNGSIKMLKNNER